MMLFVIIINIFYNIPVKFFLRTDQRLDPSLKSKGKKRILLYHVFIKFPNLCDWAVGNHMLQQFPDLDQEI